MSQCQSPVPPFCLCLTCVRALRAAEDDRAPGVLREAQRLLQERAAAITDEALRRSYLEDVVCHRELAAL